MPPPMAAALEGPLEGDAVDVGVTMDGDVAVVAIDVENENEKLEVLAVEILDGFDIGGASIRLM